MTCYSVFQKDVRFIVIDCQEGEVVHDGTMKDAIAKQVPFCSYLFTFCEERGFSILWLAREWMRQEMDKEYAEKIKERDFQGCRKLVSKFQFEYRTVSWTKELCEEAHKVINLAEKEAQ